MEAIALPETAQARFDSNIERLAAVESVVGFVAAMADGKALKPTELPDFKLFGHEYLNSQPMVQKRIDRICDELAEIARAGGQALLQLKSSGRTNVTVAADRLISEIGHNAAQITALLQTRI